MSDGVGGNDDHNAHRGPLVPPMATILDQFAKSIEHREYANHAARGLTPVTLIPIDCVKCSAVYGWLTSSVFRPGTAVLDGCTCGDGRQTCSVMPRSVPAKQYRLLCVTGYAEFTGALSEFAIPTLAKKGAVLEMARRTH